MHIIQGVSVLIEIGADVNAGECGKTPLCVAVCSSKEKLRMVQLLLEHEITGVNVREALKITWELNLDSVTGLLLEHISVDRSRDSVNLSGLELTTLKPLWILPSLGVRTLLEVKQNRRHRKQRSLGHVTEILIRRKSIATDPATDDSESFVESNKRDSRKLSVDFSSLKYVSEAETVSETEEIDCETSVQHLLRNDVELEETSNEAKNLLSGLSGRVDSSSPKIPDPVHSNISSRANDDSGVDTVMTAHQLNSSRRVISEPKKLGIVHGIMSRSSLRRQSHGTVSGASTLPNSTLDQYTLNHKSERIASERSESFSVALSPSQLFKKMRRHHRKNGSKRLLSESSGSSARADSPIPIIYSSYQNESIEDSFALISLSEEIDRSNELSLKINESNFMSDSSPGRNTSTESTTSAETDEVDFGVCAPIPEEPSDKDGTNSNLIKVLDLSSNKLTNFKALDHSEYGDLVFKRLKDVTSLDLKQNNLSELLSVMMKVCICSFQYIKCVCNLILLIGNVETQPNKFELQ